MTATRLPEDWQLPDDWREFSLLVGLDSATIDWEADKFLDYWIAVPGQKGLKLNWCSTWRNWCRRVVEDKAKHVKQPSDRYLLEQAQEQVGENFYPRVSVAHLQNVDPGDWPRFAELGVSANFTVWWLGPDQPDPVAAGLGPELANDTYRVRAISDAGGNVTFSSDDWTLSVLSPFLGMQVANTRQYPREWLTEGQDPDAIREPASEKLPIELLIKGYTINGAYQLRMEDSIGTIEAGKIADFVVLGEKLFEADPYAIHKIKPDAVVMEGVLIQGGPL